MRQPSRFRLLTQIDDETRARGAAADEQRLSIMDIPATTATYRAFLLRVHGFEGPVEAALHVTGGLLDIIDLRARLHTRLLRSDLAALGVVDLTRVPRCTTIPRFGDVLEAVQDSDEAHTDDRGQDPQHRVKAVLNRRHQMEARQRQKRLVAERGFKTVDVVSIAPDNPNRDEMRRKFLDEHFHKEDEVRFFVAGSGLFTLHVDGKVYEIECVKDDLIAVPDGTRHWFDMGEAPSFVAIRFFTEPDGWVGHFTGTDIAQKFPRYEPAA